MMHSQKSHRFSRLSAIGENALWTAPDGTGNEVLEKGRTSAPAEGSAKKELWKGLELFGTRVQTTKAVTKSDNNYSALSLVSPASVPRFRFFMA
jgi:hypothetical protein